jgi:hypothetical protein
MFDLAMNLRRSVLLAPLAWAFPALARPVLPPELVGYAGEALAELIEAARRQAIADGVSAMPPGIFRELLGFFPADELRHVRWGVGGKGVLELPSLAFEYGDAVAMTLGEVVMFKSEHDAEVNAKLWAHEMTHVMQYQRWGVEGFAHRYAEDSAAVEKEAIDNANRFVAWSHGRG